MFGKALRSLCTKRIIAAITIAQFIAGAPAAAFAAGGNLRPSAAKSSHRVYEVRKDLKDGGLASGALVALDGWNDDYGFIRVQSNMTGLFRGAQTGGMNTDLARKQGANGNLIDHSENRERLEGAVKDMVVAMLAGRSAILDELARNKENAPKVYNLQERKIKRNSTLTEQEKIQMLVELQAQRAAQMEGLQPAADKALEDLEGEYFISTKERMSRLERMTGLNAENQKTVLSWVAAKYGGIKGIFDIEALADLVAQITNLVKNQELKADIAFSKAYYKMFGSYPYKVTTLCLGEKKSQYDPDDPVKAWNILERDLRQMLAGISMEDAEIIGLRLAYEPRWVIGADTIPTDVLAKINDTHGFIKKISLDILGMELAVDYGAAVKAGTIESILALENVDGVLIGSAANDPATLKPIIEKTAAYVKKTGKQFNLGINWKANDSDNGLKELQAFVSMLKGVEDLDLITITIATPNVTDTRAAMDKVEGYFAKASLNALGYFVDRTEDIGSGYTRDILSRHARSSVPQAVIEGLFGEDTRAGDIYTLLKKDGVAFAVAKDNPDDQTLMTVPVNDLTGLKEKEAYYAALLESASLMTTKTGRIIELIEEKGDRLKSYLSSSAGKRSKLEAFSLNTLSGTKYWFGRERFFQLEYKPQGAARDARLTMLTAKPTERAIARGVSFIIQPTYRVLVNGYGTIGAKAAAAARKSGFFVMVTARSVKVDSRDAFLKDYPVVLSDTNNASDFEKHGMQVVGGINEVLEIVDFVIDATPAKVGAGNIKNIYSKFPNLRVILEGGEKAAEGVDSFSSGTNYDSVRDSRIVRVVSCNTTAMARTFGKAAEKFKDIVIKNLLMRRASDPGDEKGENPDGISLLPISHHGDDLRAVLSAEANANIIGLRTTAVVTPTTHFHVHSGTISGPGVTAAKIQELFKAQSRVALVQFPGGELKTPPLFDIFNSMIKDAHHPFIVAAQVEETGEKGEVAITIVVPQESNVVPENVNALQAMAGLANKDAAIRIVNEVLNIGQIKEGLEQRLPVDIQKDGGEGEVVIPIDYLTLDDVDVKGRIVLYRGDFNAPVENGKLGKPTARMKANAATIKELQQKGAKVAIMVHQGRKGDEDYLENLRQYADQVSELINAPVRYVDDLYDSDARRAVRSMKNGEVLVLKNVRSWDPETAKKMTLAEQAQSGMVRALSPLIDLEVLDAFSIAHRNNISVVGFQAAGVPLVAGRLMEKEIKGNYRAALVGEKPYIASFGGAKIDDYLGVIRKGLNENIYTKVHMSGLLGELAVMAQGYNLGEPTIKFLAEQFKDYSDAKYGAGLEGMVNAVKELLEIYGDRIEVPIDLAYLDADGKRVEVVLTGKHKTAPAAETLIGDIGTLTAEKYAAQLKEAKTVFVKGPWGNYKNIEFIKASDIISEALKGSAAYLITGGGDTNVLFDRLGMTDRIDYFSLAGGAFLEFMEGKALPGLVALNSSAKKMFANAQKLGVSKIEFLKHAINDKFLFARRAGDAFDALVSAIEKAKPAKNGDLGRALWSAEIIEDSRRDPRTGKGKPTVKAKLQIGDITVEGFVPAGTSTGEDEANTVDPSQAVINIVSKIGPMLAAAGLDLGSHEDLVRADRMLQEAAGENFKELGANATLPVSWAMWKMAAKLHNMPLWMYFRMYEPRAVGKGNVYNYYNFGNGGEHSMQDESERLGIDRMSFQEIKFVTSGARTDRESLAWADVVDAIYKRKLIELAGAENVTRALERGLTAKGIADPLVMTDLLIQAGIEAGLRPGIDFRIALDIAANSFYDPQTKRYFISEEKQLTASEMREYVLEYVDTLMTKYHPDLFVSIEDPLSENEWHETAVLTLELTARGILLVGDDLFVTQIRRVSRGVSEGAGTVVLVKPNQNGTIIGTIDTVEYGLNNGMEMVASHRSGETLDPALADLAIGLRMFAIKTGAPQPESEYPNPLEWERRNKYLRKIQIQEQEAQLQKALVIGPEFFTAGGTVNALKQTLVLNRQVQFVVYGENAESIKALIADASLLTAANLTDAVTMLRSFDVPARNIVLIGSAGTADADAVKDIRQIPATDGMRALAEALNALLADEATEAAFAAFNKAMADFKVEESVSDQVDQAIRDEEEFFNKV